MVRKCEACGGTGVDGHDWCRRCPDEDETVSELLDADDMTGLGASRPLAQFAREGGTLSEFMKSYGHIGSGSGYLPYARVASQVQVMTRGVAVMRVDPTLRPGDLFRAPGGAVVGVVVRSADQDGWGQVNVNINGPGVRVGASG